MPIRIRMRISKVAVFSMFPLSPWLTLPSVGAEADGFIAAETRVAIFDQVLSEIERIDGEGLPARNNRPEAWKTTIAELRSQARKAETKIDFGQVFRKLDATYPNLHAQLTLDDKYDIAAGRLRPKIAFKFGAEVIGPKQTKFNYMISSIDTELIKDIKEVVRPALGDNLVAINGKSMSIWSNENFLYCKFPLRQQCEANIFDHFRKGFLSWDWRSPLTYTLERNGRTWEVKVPVELPNPNAKNPPSQDSKGDSNCPVEPDRYEGFKPVFQGLNICVFESETFPNVTVLRIASFRYRDLPKESKIQSLKDEVEQFNESYWKAKATSTRKLIVDVLDNGGGDTPVAWYQLFYSKPFQEQYVQFKKLMELEDDHIRKDLFYDDAAKEIWFSDLKKGGTYERVKLDSFLPTIPQFCAHENQSCDKGLYEPLKHGFKGKVRIMVNEWCISSCSGFVWSMKDQLGTRAKLVGFPDSGDTAYARLFLDVYLESSSANGFRLQVSPRPGRTRQNLPDGAILRQQVTATRSTDSKGKVISATPTKTDIWIPYRYRHYDDSWASLVFKAALIN
jgi:hypothetical protein